MKEYAYCPGGGRPQGPGIGSVRQVPYQPDGRCAKQENDQVDPEALFRVNRGSGAPISVMCHCDDFMGS